MNYEKYILSGIAILTFSLATFIFIPNKCFSLPVPIPQQLTVGVQSSNIIIEFSDIDDIVIIFKDNVPYWQSNVYQHNINNVDGTDSCPLSLNANSTNISILLINAKGDSSLKCRIKDGSNYYDVLNTVIIGNDSIKMRMIRSYQITINIAKK